MCNVSRLQNVYAKDPNIVPGDDFENLPENRYSVVAHRHTILKVISVFGEITHISLSKHGIDNR
ncbi:hypothetical protein [Cognaticolwellia beringensis]|uniref:hypothetical protein n=1 Tax=Cognaticolwellia beringensis TaxID=1967665 RepID=UPI0012F76DD9|nr:hypothetical protein [Cognaticolwellia beringensis]